MLLYMRLPSNQDIENATDGLHKYIHRELTQNVSIENAIIIGKYIKYQRTEINLSDGYRKTIITCLISLAKHFKNKNFK